MDFPELDIPAPPALVGLGRAPWSPCSRRNQPRRGTASAPCAPRSPRTRDLCRGPRTTCRQQGSPKTAPICTKGDPRQQRPLPQPSSLVLAGANVNVTLLPKYSPASPTTGCLSVGGLRPPSSGLPSPPPITRGSPQANACKHQINGVLQPSSLGLVSPSVMQEGPAARCNHGK